MSRLIVIVGAGPAGLMAADVLSATAAEVHVYDAMPSPGRKFLLAGKGGLNLTHSEPFALFASRYGERRAQIEPMLALFGPAEVREWARGLGVDTFVGSSGRVFPCDLKAAPLLRAWLHRLRAAGVQMHMRHRWTGWDGAGNLVFDAAAGRVAVRADGVVLALGGASWARLGSDGAWVQALGQRGVTLAPLVPANCGFDVRGGWSAYFSGRFAGQPFKSVAIGFKDSGGRAFGRKGEFVATASGVEGSLIYAVSALLRDEIDAKGHATFSLDLLPDKTAVQVLAAVAHPRGSRSLANHLKSRLGIEGIKLALLHELLPSEVFAQPQRLAFAIKALPVTVVAVRPINEAISTAGGVSFDALDQRQMLLQLPGVCCAGEMLDWEAPTGGYLLTACLSSGRRAGQGLLEWLESGPAADGQKALR